MTNEVNKPDNGRREAAVLPPVDVIEDATGITLYADLPGVPRDRLQLRVEGDQLIITRSVPTVTIPDPDS